MIAAGAHSPSVAALAGVELEGYPWRIDPWISGLLR